MMNLPQVLPQVILSCEPVSFTTIAPFNVANMVAFTDVDLLMADQIVGTRIMALTAINTTHVSLLNMLDSVSIMIEHLWVLRLAG